ncbi:hypothetical protein ACFY9N_14130 [Microbacterium sp. NPDC008134]|uniref:hypothetical protein n=1 Tax=Microbacterium sp. NPDC008134 TaxID=3364183 RepID=UPI0036F0973C
MIRGRFERVGSPTPPAALGAQPAGALSLSKGLGPDEVRVSIVIEDALGFVHHYDDIVTTSEAATAALKTLAHIRVKTVVT